MADNITRCPKCHTSFRITQAHLKTAKGSVRCGSCLTIFNAIDHLTIVPAQKPESQPVIEDKQEELISDDMGNEEPEEEFSDEFTDTFHTHSSNDQDFSLFERDSTLEEDREDNATDDSWALELLSDSKPEEDEVDAEQDEEVRTEEERTLHEEQEAPHVDYESFYHTDKFRIIADENQEEAQLSGIHRAFDEAEYSNHDIEDINYGVADTPESGHANTSVSPGLSAQFLDSIEPEPMEFWVRSGSLWNSNWLWVPLCLIAAVSLFIQFSLIKIDSYGRQAEFRPYYNIACKYIGCQLPPLKDTSKIKTRNPVVRKHPEQDSALIVDFIIQNSATFEQEFPSIELAFTDHTNQLVAHRCFKPKEYLGGELAGRKTMPIKQPIHIALEIADPGEKASGYKIGTCF